MLKVPIISGGAVIDDPNSGRTGAGYAVSELGFKILGEAEIIVPVIIVAVPRVVIVAGPIGFRHIGIRSGYGHAEVVTFRNEVSDKRVEVRHQVLLRAGHGAGVIDHPKNIDLRIHSFGALLECLPRRQNRK